MRLPLSWRQKVSKYLWRILTFSKVAGCRAATLLKIGFLVDFAKFLKKPFFVQALWSCDAIGNILNIFDSESKNKTRSLSISFCQLLLYISLLNLLYINPFVLNAPFLYSLKISENLTVFSCSEGVEKGCIGKEWAKVLNVTITLA